MDEVLSIIASLVEFGRFPSHFPPAAKAPDVPFRITCDELEHPRAERLGLVLFDQFRYHFSSEAFLAGLGIGRGLVPVIALKSGVRREHYILLSNLQAKTLDRVRNRPDGAQTQRSCVIVSGMIRGGDLQLHVASVLRAAGFTVQQCIAVLETGEAGREQLHNAGISLSSLVMLTDLARVLEAEERISRSQRQAVEAYPEELRKLRHSIQTE